MENTRYPDIKSSWFAGFHYVLQHPTLCSVFVSTVAMHDVEEL